MNDPKLYKPRFKDWGEVYRNALRKGCDHGYAAYLANEWEKRQEKKTCTGKVS